MKFTKTILFIYLFEFFAHYKHLDQDRGSSTVLKPLKDVSSQARRHKKYNYIKLNEY